MRAVAAEGVTNIEKPCGSWDMANTEGEPRRLAKPELTKRRCLPFTRKIALPEPSPIPMSFILALAERRSAERFASIDLSDLATWLYYCSTVQSVHSDDRNRQQRFVASFGALHPAHILLGNPDGKWFTYVSGEHALGELAVDANVAFQLRNLAAQLFAAPEATLVSLISDTELAESYYENASGLILRDAGVLLGHGALVAAAIGIGFRILGSTGGPLLEKMVCDLPFRAMATGLAWIGGRKYVT